MIRGKKGGKVVIRVTVDASGKVTGASFEPKGSTTDAAELIEAAKAASVKKASDATTKAAAPKPSTSKPAATPAVAAPPSTAPQDDDEGPDGADGQPQAATAGAATGDGESFDLFG